MASVKTAIITGGNKGIGFEVARRLGNLGYGVWLGCRDAARGEAAAARLRGMGHDARVLHLDVTEAASIAAAVAHFRQHTGALDTLVNNAGIILARKIHDGVAGVA